MGNAYSCEVILMGMYKAILYLTTKIYHHVRDESLMIWYFVMATTIITAYLLSGLLKYMSVSGMCIIYMIRVLDRLSRPSDLSHFLS